MPTGLTDSASANSLSGRGRRTGTAVEGNGWADLAVESSYTEIWGSSPMGWGWDS